MKDLHAPDPVLMAAYRRRKMTAMHRTLVEAYILVGGVFSLSMLAIADIVTTTPGVATKIRAFALVMLVVSVAIRSVYRRKIHLAIAFALVGECAIIAFFAFLLRSDLMGGLRLGGMMSSTALMTAAAMMVGLGPGGRGAAAARGIAYFAAVAVATAPWARDALSYLFAFKVAELAAGAYKHKILRSAESEADTEFAVLSKVAPLSVVRRVAESLDPIETVFAATERQVVCVSSDWRGYQRLSTDLAPEEIAATIETYYAMCERLLADIAPEGDYYCDWIADELFVVFFDLGGGHDLADRAVTFARRLIVKKGEFILHHPAPRGIDIGIGGGTALVGMLGASSLSKVTAVGATPAKVRRLQTEAKALRKRFGDQDRIVVGAEILPAAAGARRIPGVDEELYYLELRETSVAAA